MRVTPSLKMDQNHNSKDKFIASYHLNKTKQKKQTTLRTHKHGAGGWVGFDLAVGQRPSGLVEVSGHSAGRSVSRGAAQVAVGTQSLSRAVADLQVEREDTGSTPTPTHPFICEIH